MKPRFSLTAAVVIGLAAVSAAQPKAQDADPVVAIVNGTEILRSDLERAKFALPEQYRQMPLEMMFEPLVGRMIDQTLLSDRALNSDIDQDPEVQAVLETARKDVLRTAYLERAVIEGSTDERLQEVYATMSAQPGFTKTEVHAQHILVEDEEAAKAVIVELDGGADFAEVAKAQSIDPSAANNGGDLGYFEHGQMVPEFADAAFALEPGTVGDAPVQSQFGWHVIKVLDKRERTPSFEEVEPQLRDQVAREIVAAILEDVREGAQIERFNLDGTPMPAQ